MLYDRVKATCKEKNVPIWKLEADVGLSRGSVCKWNENSPSVDRVKKVADYLGTTVDELLSDKAV